MKIRITNISIGDDQSIEVEFNTDAGKGKALWVGQKPDIEGVYAIEIEIPSILQWKIDILLCQDKVFQIKMKRDGRISLIGILDIVEDTFASLKLGNSNVLIETKGIPFEEGVWIEVIAEKIIVYDTNI